MKKISIVASLALAGALSFSIIGCGSSGGSAGSTSSGPVVNSYLVKLISPAQDESGQTSTKVIYDNGKTTGRVQFSKVITGVITVPKDAIIDSNANYKFDASDKPVGFDLKGKATDAAITPLTTLAVEKNVTLPASLQGDPIAKLKAGDPTAYLAEQAIIKAVQAKGYDPTALKDINVTSDGALTTDSTDLTVKQALDIASPAAIAVVKAAITAKELNVTEVVQKAEEGTLIQDAVQKVIENNITVSDVNESALQDLNTTAEAIKTHIDSLPPKLLVGGLTVGGTSVTLDTNNSFSVTVNTTGKSVTDFYDVSFGAAVTKTFTPITGVGVTVQITDTENSSNSVSLTIQGATISPSTEGNSVVVSLPVGSTIAVTQTGLPALESVIGASASTTTTKALTMDDLGFNAQTLLNALPSNNKIAEAIAALNTYIAKPRTYNVTISFTGVNGNALDVDATSYSGTVTVENTPASSSSSSSEASSSSESSSSSEASSSSSTCTEALDPFGNPTGSYVDQDGNPCTP